MKAFVQFARPVATTFVVIGCSVACYERESEASPSVVDGKIAASEVIARADYWYQRRNGFTYGGKYYPMTYDSSRGPNSWAPDAYGRMYGRDCSGLVSNAWHLGTSRNTNTLLSIMKQVPIDAIQKGDAVEKNTGGTQHVQLFDHWVDSSHTKWVGYSFGYAPMQKATYTRVGDSMMSGGGWYAYHYPNVFQDVTPTTIRGALDGIACDGIVGWAQDKATPTQALDVTLRFDGSSASAPSRTLLANKTRADLCTAIGSCEHGFAIRPPRALRDGKTHAVYAYGGTTLLANAPKSFSCAPEPLPKMGRRLVVSSAAFKAWSFDPLDVGQYADSDVESLPALANAPATPRLAISDDGTVWVLDGEAKRRIVDMASLFSWSFDASNAMDMPATELATMPTGPDWPRSPILVKGTGPEVDVLDVLDVDLTPPPDGQAQPPVVPGDSIDDDVNADHGCNASGSAPSLAWVGVGLALLAARTRRRKP